ncbi:MAG: glycosyl hydrolase family 28 protein [Chitinophagaceae bacterium]
MKYFTLWLLFSTMLLCPAKADNLIVYDAPKGITAAQEFALEVNGQKVFIYNTPSAAYACFSFEGKVKVKVIFMAPVYNYDIRPKSRKIEGELYRNQISFSLTKPENLSIEINKNLKRPLFIFANPLETNTPNKNDSNVIYFEAGKIYTPGIVRLKSNETVYIAGGAVVRGSFITDGGKNIQIMGRGIIDNGMYKEQEARPIEINQSQNVLLEGFIIADAKHWCCASFASKNITYRNIKIVSDNAVDDGIDIVGSRDVLVDNCFIKTKDDCIAIKSGVNYFTKFNSGFTVDNIVVQNSVMWNGVWGNGLEIGFETRTDTIQNVTFRNCDLIHVEGPEGTFTIHNGDRALVKNILYEDVRVEDARGWLIDFKILKSRFSKDTQRGKIENVHFKNITVEGEQLPYSQLMGFDDTFNITNVLLENFYLHGIKVNSTYNGLITAIHTEKLTFK